MSENTTMTLKTGEHFSLNQTAKDSPLEGLAIFVRNNGDNVIKVSTEGNNILITVEKATE